MIAACPPQGEVFVPNVPYCICHWLKPQKVHLTGEFVFVMAVLRLYACECGQWRSEWDKISSFKNSISSHQWVMIFVMRYVSRMVFLKVTFLATCKKLGTILYLNSMTVLFDNPLLLQAMKMGLDLFCSPWTSRSTKVRMMAVFQF